MINFISIYWHKVPEFVIRLGFLISLCDIRYNFVRDFFGIFSVFKFECFSVMVHGSQLIENFGDIILDIFQDKIIQNLINDFFFG